MTSPGSRSDWRQEAEEKVVQGKGYVRDTCNMDFRNSSQAISLSITVELIIMLKLVLDFSQGQGQPRRHSRQSHLRQAL